MQNPPGDLQMTDDIPGPTKRARIRLVPPEPDIRLYEDGFEKDALGRESAGRELSNLLDMVDGRFVVAVDGKWGSGKTHFLKCWCGERARQGKAIIHFDAFQHDHVSAPLPAMVAVMRARFDTDGRKGWKAHAGNLLDAAWTLGKPVARGALAPVGLGALVDMPAGVTRLQERCRERSRRFRQDAFWETEAGRLKAMNDFRAALGEVVREDGPMVIVIDELDRCRPDYALEALETVKHLFAVDGVHFVLGVNLEALEHIVRARYGAGFDDRKYLNRFIQVVFSLPEAENFSGYLRHLLEAMNLNVANSVMRMLEEHLEIVSSVNDVSLRDVGDIVSWVALLKFDAIHKGADELTPGNPLLMVVRVMLTLIVLQVVRPDLHGRFLEGDPTDEDLRSYIGNRSVEDPGTLLLGPFPGDSEYSKLVHGWTAIRGIDDPSEDDTRFRHAHFGLKEDIKHEPKRIHERFLARIVPYRFSPFI